MSYLVTMGLNKQQPLIELTVDDIKQAVEVMQELASPFQDQPNVWEVTQNRDNLYTEIKALFTQTHVGYIIEIKRVQ